MDAVVTGLIGGSTISLLVVVGIPIAIWQGLPEKIASPTGSFIWLALLTSLVLGNMFLTWSVCTALWAAPSQTDSATHS